LNGTGSLTINGSATGDVVTITGAGATVSATSATIVENAGASATVNGNSDTFIYTPSFGQDALTGFNVSGTGHDILQFSIADFSYLTSGMSQAADLAAVIANGGITQSGSNSLITDSLGDKLTLNAISSATLTANTADFVFR
jgi:hypothetical protein